MPGPKYNYLNIRDQLSIINYSGCITFGDNDLYISSSSDGTLDIGANTGLNLKASTTIPTGFNLTVTDGTVNLGTGALTLGGNSTLSTGKYLAFTAGAESLRFPNDGVLASGCGLEPGVSGTNIGWHTPLVSSQVFAWLGVKVASGASSTYHRYFIPMFSSASADRAGGSG